MVRAGGGRVAGEFQQMGAHGREPVVPGHPGVGVKLGEHRQAGLRAVGHGGRDRVVERGDRVGRDPAQDPVQDADLPPVGVGGLGGQVGPLQVRAGAGGVALIEDQVEDVQDGAQPLGVLRSRRHGEGRPGGPDPLLGPADPRRHRRLGHQERLGDLGRGEAADGAQGQGDLRGRGERGMAAHEEQGQGVVPVRRERLAGLAGRGLDQRVGRLPAGDERLAAAAGLLAADLVDEPAGGDGDQPAAGMLRHAVGRPPAGRRPATGRPPRAAPPEGRPRRCRSRRTCAGGRRGPAAPARAADR